MYQAILYTAVAYIFKWLPYPAHFHNIFLMEHFLAVKIAMGHEEKYELSCHTKISKYWKKLNGTGLL